MTLAALSTSPISDLVGSVASLPTHAPTPLVRSHAEVGAPDIEVARTNRRPEIAPVPVPTSYLNGLSLFGIAQMLQLESKTCLLEVTSSALRGTLGFVNGNVIDAEVGEIVGDKAVEQMLGWHEPTVWIHEATRPRRMTVTKPVAQLLLESLRRLDESTPDAAAIGDPFMPATAVPQATEASSEIALVADAQSRLNTMARTNGVIAVALLSGPSKTIVARAATSSEFAGDRLDAEIEEIAAFSLLAHLASGEVRFSRQASQVLIMPLHPTRGIFLYLAMKPTTPHLTRTARRLTRQAAALLS